ncbi:DUF1902 domain-containing protein [Chitinimonas arctica]|uniref:DUF1902 domain-containing protein n=1 Tax=Chitinimonas arctica TaxID=2594795 RepID=A0A516SD86_9NEIS|nr:DUF1902 domain-containing protein [Chitinimonas arctica]QDQ26100.1 DUF1902 domain-containing protein [Chitinimonas arctica]
MRTATYHILAEWDEVAAVWVATSDDVPGLATEAPSVDTLLQKLDLMIPELLELNGCAVTDTAPFELVVHRHARGMRRAA